MAFGGDSMGNSKTVYSVGWVTAGSLGTPFWIIICVSGSVLAPRTRLTYFLACHGCSPLDTPVSWLTVPDGLTHVIAAAGLMPVFCASFLLVVMACCLSVFSHVMSSSSFFCPLRMGCP